MVDQLVEFVRRGLERGIPQSVLHAAKRLLLNQLKATALAAQQPGARAVHDALLAQPQPPGAVRDRCTLWFGVAATHAQAQSANGVLYEALDFGDTDLVSLRQPTSRVLPALLADAEARSCDGRSLLTSLALGLEVELASAALWPDTGAAVGVLGSVAAKCALSGASSAETSLALHAVLRARGTPAAQPCGLRLLERMLGDPGRRWLLLDIALHTCPVPVLAHAAVEAALSLRERLGGTEPLALRLHLHTRLWTREGRMALEGLATQVALAWQCGQLGTEELLPSIQQHPAVQALRERIELLPETDAARDDAGACTLQVQRVDGNEVVMRVDAFLGSPQRPLNDAQLSELFRAAAEELVLPVRAGKILYALWSLDNAPDVRALLGLLRQRH